MGQQEIYDFLKKNKNKWYSAKEIYEEINIKNSLNSIMKAMGKLECDENIQKKFEKHHIYSNMVRKVIFVDRKK